MLVSTRVITFCFHQAVKHSQMLYSDLQNPELGYFLTAVPETFYVKATTENRHYTYLKELSK